MQIFNAYQAGDATAAKEAMCTHISIIANLMFDRYQHNGALAE